MDGSRRGLICLFCYKPVKEGPCRVRFRPRLRINAARRYAVCEALTILSLVVPLAALLREVKKKTSPCSGRYIANIR